MVAGREDNLRDKSPYGCRNGSHNLVACIYAFLIVHITVHGTWHGSVPTSKTTRAVSFFLKSDVQQRSSSTQEKTKPHNPPSLKTCSRCEDLLLIGKLGFVDQLNSNYLLYYHTSGSMRAQQSDFLTFVGEILVEHDDWSHCLPIMSRNV